MKKILTRQNISVNPLYVTFLGLTLLLFYPLCVTFLGLTLFLFRSASLQGI